MDLIIFLESGVGYFLVSIIFYFHRGMFLIFYLVRKESIIRKYRRMESDNVLNLEGEICFLWNEMLCSESFIFI